MARIPESEIEAIKSQIDLVALVRAKGVELKTHGDNLIGLCPFHDDTNPSLVVTPTKNLWHCMGACQKGGSVIDWIMMSEGIKFRHAVELIRAGDPSKYFTSKIGPRVQSIPLLPSPVALADDDQEMLKQTIEFYHDSLQKNPEALSYLAARRIRDEEAIEKFKIGYSNRTLGIRLPGANRQLGANLRGKLQAMGIIRNTGHEHFAGSIVIPVMGLDGKITEVYGRKITRNLRSGTPDHTYLPGPHKGIWNPECLQSEEVILCEALIDALSFWINGFKNVTASYGVSGFTEDHLAGFIEHGVKKVYIAYDRDEAGDIAAAALGKRLAGEGIAALRVNFPKRMDANEFICKMSPARQALRVCLESAAWIGKPGRAASKPAAKEEKIIEEPAVEAIEESAAAAIVSVTEQIDQAPTLPEEILPAVKTPHGSLPDIPTEQRGEDVFIWLGEREYRIRGLARNLSCEVMRVNVRSGIGLKYHVDMLDLYQAKARTAYINAAASELGLKEEVIKRDLGRVLLKLEELQEANIKKQLEGEKKEVFEMTEPEKAEALELLQSKDLLDRIVGDFEKCGVIGEETNKLVGYLAATSRKLEEPLAVMIQSSSAAGKSSLMEAVLAMMPDEERVKYSAMTGQSLFYIGENNLKHKILAIVEEQGAQQAAYALKLLQSEGEISIASTGKDPASGRLVTHEYRVEGPVMIFLTTTAIEVDEELANRCIVLGVDEARAQTKAIHEQQRERQTLEGVLHRSDRRHVQRVHKNAQRLLRPLLVVNPFARKLTFIDSRTRTRRDHIKYLTLIRAVALLHQYQREVKTVMHRGEVIEYIEVTASDIETANRLCHEVLGSSLDELPPQTRRLLGILCEMVESGGMDVAVERADYRFTRKQVRFCSGWSDQQLQVHLGKLVALEYVLAHRGGRGQSFVYELLYDGDGKTSRPYLPGLIGLTGSERENKAKIHECDSEINDLTQRFFHEKEQINGSSLGHLCPIFGGPTMAKRGSGSGNKAKSEEIGKNAYMGGVSENVIVSYMNHGVVDAEGVRP